MQQAINHSRRRLFRAKISPCNAVRPPWSLPEEQFLNSCERCNDCITACETNLLKRGDGGFPEADFSHAECTFCEACVNACNHGAISKNTSHQPWQITAQIKSNCLAQNKVHCRTCSEQCEQEAIQFRLAPGGIALPNLETELCNGCGACVASCPVSAIAVLPANEKTL
ncbi:ferredoxin-type protein NapF [Parendozoicomonas sp. Alg238-R29]|uniref:ferredoxin-type protein NapF n=1 Tax=Parendozoicomonas sp. Alg238-R29 TaxID=2993446 RepID=UPI00248D7AD5|nr:ferredoxin-type protein NapF [Parendozoicomonas sp. Alg238-R29]